MGEPPILLEGLAEPVAIEPRHPYITDDEIRCRSREHMKPLHPIPGSNDRVATLSKYTDKPLRLGLAVLQDKDFFLPFGSLALVEARYP